ncbi:MAG: twin-arginine translocase TatA/TatE family subunit [Bacteroidales bacterium]|nr:twin-arginine translocase TatA/TatE family subunit [Bacteroidales bacterium]
MNILLFIGGPEIIVILLFVLLLFGSKRIPEVARMMGKGMREFRRATEDIKREINDNTKDVKEDINDFKDNLPKN